MVEGHTWQKIIREAELTVVCKGTDAEERTRNDACFFFLSFFNSCPCEEPLVPSHRIPYPSRHVVFFGLIDVPVITAHFGFMEAAVRDVTTTDGAAAVNSRAARNTIRQIYSMVEARLRGANAFPLFRAESHVSFLCDTLYVVAYTATG